MTRLRFTLGPTLIAVGIALPQALDAQSTQSFVGELTAGTGAAGEAAAPREHTFQVANGQPVRVRLSSDDFDTILRLIPPSGEPMENDDFEGTDSQISTVSGAGGTWRAIVSAYEDGAGDYRLEISLGAPGTARDVGRGELSPSDSISAKGHRYDQYSVNIASRSQLVLEMTATDFSPMVVAFGPQGKRFSSEGNGSGGTASLDIPVAEPGAWRIVATQAETSTEATGAYAIRMLESPTSATDEVRTGSLEASDRRQVMGEFYDTFDIPADANRSLTLVLASSDFDAFIAARSPSGEWLRDDDSGGESNARLVLPASSGRWYVIVTSYEADETGEYTLTITK